MTQTSALSDFGVAESTFDARGPLTLYCLNKTCREHTFLSFSVVTRSARHDVVAPFPAAPLLSDVRRSTVGSGTSEDIVAVAGKLRYMTRFMSVTFGGLVCLGALRDARRAS